MDKKSKLLTAESADYEDQGNPAIDQISRKSNNIN
jgi:hypothetical protein